MSYTVINDATKRAREASHPCDLPDREIKSEEPAELGGLPATKVTYVATHGDYEPTAFYVDGCVACDHERANREAFFPNHFGSRMCESGGRPHCTCDRCF